MHNMLRYKSFFTFFVTYLAVNCMAVDDKDCQVAECLNKMATYFKITLIRDITKYNYKTNQDVTAKKCVQNAIKFLKYEEGDSLEFISERVYYLKTGKKLRARDVLEPSQFCQIENSYLQEYNINETFNKSKCLEDLKKFESLPENRYARTFVEEFRTPSEKFLRNAFYVYKLSDFEKGDYGAEYMQHIESAVSLDNIQEPIDYCKSSI